MNQRRPKTPASDIVALESLVGNVRRAVEYLSKSGENHMGGLSELEALSFISNLEFFEEFADGVDERLRVLRKEL